MPENDPKSPVDELILLLDTSQLHAPDIAGIFSLHQLDLARNALNRMLYAVNHMHNTKVPINRAIRDIVYRVFVMSVSSSEHPARQSLDISHVCRHWRQLALEWPVLWSSVDSRCPKISMLFLKRSETGPLDLTVSDRAISPFTGRPRLNYLPQVEWRKCLSLIPTLIPRLRSLTLHINDPEKSKEILPYFTHTPTLLRLQALEICLPIQDQLLVPEHFLNPEHPPKSLVLQGNVLRWEKPPIYGLTRLIIWGPRAPPAVHQLMSIISTSRGLEELELRYIFGPLFYSSEPIVDPQALEFQGEIIDLPHLWRLRFSAATSMCSQFLKPVMDHIHAPALKTFYLDSLLHGPAPALHPFELLPSNPPYPFSALTHVHITQREFGRALKGQMACDGPSLGQWDENHLDLLLRGSTSQEDPADRVFMLRVLRMLRGVQRLELHLDAWNYVGAESDIDLIVSMPELSTLEILGDHGDAGKASEVLEKLASCADLPITKLCSRFVEYEGALLSKLATATRIREIHLDQCSTVDRDDVSVLREFGVLVYWSEEMSFDEKISIWGDTSGSSNGWKYGWP